MSLVPMCALELGLGTQLLHELIYKRKSMWSLLTVNIHRALPRRVKSKAMPEQRADVCDRVRGGVGVYVYYALGVPGLFLRHLSERM